VSKFHKTVLDNGIRVVSEYQAHTRAVAIGVWVTVGTRNEPVKLAGISHFLEHLVFKGTKKRSAYQIVKALDEVGGELNAYTTREYTCYHALMLKEHWQRGIEVLADLVCHMNITAEHFKLEKSVVLQEINACQENPEELIYDEFLARCYKSNSLGKPILGNRNSLAAMKLGEVEGFYENQYTGSNLIISCAGALEHEKLVDMVRVLFKSKKRSRKMQVPKKPEFHSFAEVVEKNTDQIHLLIGTPSTSFKDQYRFDSFIVNALLGGGMTSKLFQSVREKKGLAYTIYSSLNTFVDTGFMSIYSAVEEKNVKILVNTLVSEIKKVKTKGITKPDIKLFKTQITGSILLGADDVENRMTSLGINEMVFGVYKPVDEIINEIQSVSATSIDEYIAKYFQLNNLGAIMVGTDVEKLAHWWQDCWKEVEEV
jgi:predicted Zn-dependent peptidase